MEGCGRGQTEGRGDYENSAEAVAGKWGGMSAVVGTEAGGLSALPVDWSWADFGKNVRSLGSFAVDSTFVTDVRTL